ncbi:MAG: 2-succinyl-5-enolpyruvyl-6-hydroxy-3-cyclohexene-carboxylic-acid synthase [Actinomycetota bacterium]|jgi:2-succinyl-5-enolpyruvyl-6-hydroxy-3-cyclohexene-1-carboxylate synthase
MTALTTANAQATFCATLVDEWIRDGVQYAYVAPGSRSTPLALALSARSEMSVEVFIDERCAAFAALGVGKATGLPAIALCTSGTAATHFSAAVTEASLSGVPLIVCTADRPPELRDVGAAQTIDQTHLYGSAVRWFHDPGVASYDAAHTWRALANHVVARTMGPIAGPVHLNLPFREPLLGEVVDMPPKRQHDATWSGFHAGRSQLSDWEIDDLAHRLAGRRGVIIAGDVGAGFELATYTSAVSVLSSVLHWPILACPLSGVRGGSANIVSHFDGIVRSQSAHGVLAPEVVLQLGKPPASKVLGQWVASTRGEVIAVHGPGTYQDAQHAAFMHIEADVANTIDRLCSVVASVGDTREQDISLRWNSLWRNAQAAAAQSIEQVLSAEGEVSDPAIARMFGEIFSVGVVSSSMPIRDVEWFSKGKENGVLFSNRGANGIDGVISTSIGIAQSLRTPVGVYLGDVAFLHDGSSLVGLKNRNVNMRIVVADNDGGGIFSFLPQASQVEKGVFENLFGTPHGADIAMLARAHGIEVLEPKSLSELSTAMQGSGTAVILLKTHRERNVIIHEKLHAAIASSVDAMTNA